MKQVQRGVPDQNNCIRQQQKLPVSVQLEKVQRGFDKQNHSNILECGLTIAKTYDTRVGNGQT